MQAHHIAKEPRCFWNGEKHRERLAHSRDELSEPVVVGKKCRDEASALEAKLKKPTQRKLDIVIKTAEVREGRVGKRLLFLFTQEGVFGLLMF